MNSFVLPVKGLKPGLHEYHYTISDDFFSAFPESPVERASLELDVAVDKKYGELSIRFDFAGTLATECDRCLAAIDFPVTGRETLLVRVTDEPDLVSDDPLLVYISPATHEFDLAKYAYEFVLLALPMIRTFACREGSPPYPCDDDMLEQIDRQSYQEPTEDEKPASPWDVLKTLKTDQNS